ncbi:hypothetical protein ZEAMMB73_Zm00001d009917 [Zea mays]|uniref:Uncharacterized protein n=1 Tax=Zea mays TaxID=4577 RepID=A0A1D6FN32_MAIZE|nr:hypothetical protein ZEAMMB73_Zm00001d009917 [Zea mays]
MPPPRLHLGTYAQPADCHVDPPRQHIFLLPTGPTSAIPQRTCPTSHARLASAAARLARPRQSLPGFPYMHQRPILWKPRQWRPDLLCLPLRAAPTNLAGTAIPPRTPYRLPLRAAPTNLEAWSMAPSPSIAFPYVLQAPALPSPMRCTHKFGKPNLRRRFWKARSRSSNHNNYTPNFALTLIKKVAIPSCAHHRPLTPSCAHQRLGAYSPFASVHGKYSKETRADIPKKEMEAERTRCQ